MKIFGYEKKFIKELGKIKDPVIFLGIAHSLKVNTMVDKDTPKEFQDVLREVIDMYFAAEPKRQKELYEILRDANKCKENFGNGNNTKNSAKTVSN